MLFSPSLKFVQDSGKFVERCPPLEKASIISYFLFIGTPRLMELHIRLRRTNTHFVLLQNTHSQMKIFLATKASIFIPSFRLLEIHEPNISSRRKHINNNNNKPTDYPPPDQPPHTCVISRVIKGERVF